MAADPIGIQRGFNVVGHRAFVGLDGVGAVVGRVPIECRANLLVRRDEGIVNSKRRTVTVHQLDRHAPFLLVDQPTLHVPP